MPKEIIQQQNVRELWSDQHKLLENAFRKKTLAEWSNIFKHTDACVMPIIPISEVAKNNHNHVRGSYIRIDEVLQPSPAPRFERTPASFPKAPIGPGHNNWEILADIGFSDEDINDILSEIK